MKGRGSERERGWTLGDAQTRTHKGARDGGKGLHHITSFFNRKISSSVLESSVRDSRLERKAYLQGKKQ